MPQSALRADEVSVKTALCGLCHSDISLARDEWREGIPTSYPFVGGHEVVGTIEAVGSHGAQPWRGRGRGGLRPCPPPGSPPPPLTRSQ